MATPKKIERCRICGNPRLERVLDLGDQMLTGVFPRERRATLTSGPLRLVKCSGDDSVCGLLQLEHSYDLAEMYGDNYGYRSGLNPSMVAHLHDKVKKALEQIDVGENDVVIDIGSNDSTTLQAFPKNATLIGIDPTGAKFRQYYPRHIHLIADFFSAAAFRQRFPGRHAKVITSFSMFYDLEAPLDFAREIHEVLSDEGIWIFEQSYMPTMLEMNAYDTVCQEHLEYYALRQIKWIMDRVGFHIVDIEFNDVNGGSFSVTVAKPASGRSEAGMVRETIAKERDLGLDTLVPYREFAKRVAELRAELRRFVENAKREGKTIAALGASTKGNVLLQYCGFSEKEIAFIGEVNTDKLGCYTPGTWIPIIREEEVLANEPDYLLILPWHFRRFFTSNPKFSGRQLLVPLPAVELVN